MIAVRSWGYRCFLTLPQIELMQADLPHTLYHFDKKGNKGPNKPVSQADIDEAERLTREAAERKQMAKKEGYTTEELFNGAAFE